MPAVARKSGVDTANTIHMAIGDLDATDGIACDETYIVYEDVTDVPEDYVGNKYKYDGTSWTKNENYYDPSKE